MGEWGSAYLAFGRAVPRKAWRHGSGGAGGGGQAVEEDLALTGQRGGFGSGVARFGRGWEALEVGHVGHFK